MAHVGEKRRLGSIRGLGLVHGLAGLLGGAFSVLLGVQQGGLRPLALDQQSELCAIALQERSARRRAEAVLKHLYPVMSKGQYRG